MADSKTPRSFRAEIWSVVTLISFTLVFFGPVQVYLGNPAEYSVALIQMVTVHAALALLVTTLAAAILSLTKPGFRKHVSPLLFCLGVALYLQGNLLLWDYGLLDGSEIDWSRNVGKGVVELFIWIGVVAAGFCFRHTIRPYIIWASLGLLVVQGVAVAVGSAQHKSLPHQLYQVDGRGLETFAAEQNILLIVVDAFQTTTFEEIIREDPSFAETARGFTYFRNAVSGYSKTLGSIPNILTGLTNLNEEPVSEFLARAFQGSVFELMRKDGYRVEIYPWADKTFHFDPKYADNILRRSDLRSAMHALPLSIDLSLFRHLPHFIKPWIYRNQQWLTSNLVSKSEVAELDLKRLSKTGGFRDKEFLERVSEMTVENTHRPLFKYIHLQGPHGPFFTDEDLSFRRLPNNQVGFLAQAKATVKILRHLLKKMQDHGIYDEATIVIVADHGGGEYRIPVPDQDGPRSKTLGVSADVIAGGLPLVLVKPAGQSGEMAVSDAPIELADVAKTIAGLLDLENDLPGRSMFEVDPAKNRERAHYHYSFDGWDKRYLPKLTEYKISGHSWSAASWQPTGRTIEPGSEGNLSPEIASKGPLLLQIGETHKFGTTGDANDILLEGWAKPEAGRVWSMENQARLAIPLPQVESNLLVSLTLTPFLRKDIVPQQTVEIFTRGVLLTTWEVSTGQDFAFAIRPSDMENGILPLEIRLPNAKSPKFDLGESGDPRRLGVAVHEIRVTKVKQLPADLTISCKQGGNLQMFAGSGWSGPEPDSTWGTGAEVSIIFDLPDGIAAGSQYQVWAELSPIIIPGVFEENPVEVLFDNRLVATWNIKSFGKHSAGLGVLRDGPHTLAFRPNIAASPAEYIEGAKDPRLLSVLIRKISLRPLERTLP